MAEPAQRSPSPGSRVVSLAALLDFCAVAPVRAGVSPHDAAAAADVLATTDAWDVCAAIRPEGDCGTRMADLVDEIRAAPWAGGVERDGIALPPDVLASVARSASMVGLDIDRDLVDRS